MNIYIDLGNSYCKILLSQAKDIFFQIKTNNLNSFTLKEIMDEKIKNNKIQKVVISSVVPKKNIYFDKYFQKNFSIKPYFVNEMEIKNVDFSLIKTKIGSDILVNAFYANTLNQNAIIISLGTATVISVLEQSKFKGSLIMPGLITSFEALFNKTAKLKKQNITKIKSNRTIGDETNSSIYLGTIKGHFLQIFGLIQSIDPLMKNKIIVTGGNFEFLKQYFDEKLNYQYIKNMVLVGLKTLSIAND